MTSQGSAHGRFTRAVKVGKVLNAETAALELGSLSPADALSLVLLYQRAGDENFERVARRWIRRAQVHHRLRHQEVELLRAAMGALGTRFDSLALDALVRTCQELRLPLPTLTAVASAGDAVRDRQRDPGWHTEDDPKAAVRLLNRGRATDR